MGAKPWRPRHVAQAHPRRHRGIAARDHAHENLRRCGPARHRLHRPLPAPQLRSAHPRRSSPSRPRSATWARNKRIDAALEALDAVVRSGKARLCRRLQLAEAYKVARAIGDAASSGTRVGVENGAVGGEAERAFGHRLDHRAIGSIGALQGEDLIAGGPCLTMASTSPRPMARSRSSASLTRARSAASSSRCSARRARRGSGRLAIYSRPMRDLGTRSRPIITRSSSDRSPISRRKGCGRRLTRVGTEMISTRPRARSGCW